MSASLWEGGGVKPLLFVAMMLLLGPAAAADWHDATQAVREQTNLAEQIADVCRRRCRCHPKPTHIMTLACCDSRQEQRSD
jgi:hypothetical protein